MTFAGKCAVSSTAAAAVANSYAAAASAAAGNAQTAVDSSESHLKML